ncbi:MAG TPA: glycosyltransferase family 4 protein [Vicinamibacterales bacterium]|jgi:glycosyltransferase involved in cell wall biosynthesis|nr:glycosyltransferase family 4 protein [Vicinamibacterales bacterium]
MSCDVVLLAPAPLDARTGGYEYDRRMAAGLRARGWRVEVRELDPSFPRPTHAARDRAARLLADVADNTTVLIDGLAFGAMPSELTREASRLRFVALIHMPLADAVGLSAAEAARLEASERLALATARLVVVTGRSTVATMERYGVERRRIAVVEPGTDLTPRARGTRRDSPGRHLELLAVGSLTEGKGYEVLIHALARIPDRAWHLTCAGSLDRDPPAVARVRAAVRREKLEDRVTLAGEVDGEALAAHYDAADVFVLATLRETYGMAVAEALAHGLPIVSTRTGAIPELVGATASRGPAGLLVPAGDVDAMSAALSQVMSDAGLRASLADAAWQARESLPAWDDAVHAMATTLERVCP